ncbi:MAG: hypothetical protein KA758_12555 [Acidimicrobiales bacterium]|nr:hypothetical protein [Acidimicrobiales bacterium]
MNRTVGGQRNTEPDRNNPGRDATDAEMLGSAVDGYHAARQQRSLATTRLLVTTAWDLMAEHPERPLRAADLLAVSGVSASSLYGRFESLHALVEHAGLIALAVQERRRAEQPDGWIAGHDTMGAVTRETFASVLEQGRLPREVLATGAWSDTYLAAFGRTSRILLRDLAAAASVLLPGHTADADRPILPTGGAGPAPGAGTPGHRRSAPGVVGDPATTYHRLLSWIHLSSAAADHLWAVIGTDRSTVDLQSLAEVAGHLGTRLFETADVSASTPHLVTAPVPRPPRVTGATHLGARAFGELRIALHHEILTRGRHVSTEAIARSVHRSRTSFFDAFGSLGAALAEVARAEQVGRIPTQVLRPRVDVPPHDLVAHLASRLHSWQDHQGITGRRLLQMAADHTDLAQEIMGQVLNSAELLTGWYHPVFDLPEDHVRALFLLILAAEQHAVVWGSAPLVITGPQALDALLRPLLRPGDEAG